MYRVGMDDGRNLGLHAGWVWIGVRYVRFYAG